jgi:hypothetical protein
MDTVLKDIRSAIRSLWRQPTFTIVAVLTLAFGIAANTSTYSVIQALILTPPSIVEPERVEGLKLCACSVFFVSAVVFLTAFLSTTEP